MGLLCADAWWKMGWDCLARIYWKQTGWDCFARMDLRPTENDWIVRADWHAHYLRWLFIIFNAVSPLFPVVSARFRAKQLPRETVQAASSCQHW